MRVRVCQVEAAAMRMSIQDLGRPGWARYGVPPGGAMDDHAANWANRLLGNSPAAPILEILGRGARLKFLDDCVVAVTGASAAAFGWRSVQVRAGETLAFSELPHGLWTCVAVSGGFASGKWLGSSSVYPAARFGRFLAPGDVLEATGVRFDLPPGVSSRLTPWTEQRDYSRPPALRVWPAPQWEAFTPAQRSDFFSHEWTVSANSDRTGYRLSGRALEHKMGELPSEPVLVGTIQVPPDGLPIVTMRDGPTVGGYPKLGVLDPDDVSWLAQTQPGGRVRFRMVDES